MVKCCSGNDVKRQALNLPFYKGRGVYGKATEAASIWIGEKWVTTIKTEVESVAVAVFVCSDSNYNQTATHSKRRNPKATASIARLIDDEHRAYAII
jgi:hypothetical protein